MCPKGLFRKWAYFNSVVNLYLLQYSTKLNLNQISANLIYIIQPDKIIRLLCPILGLLKVKTCLMLWLSHLINCHLRHTISNKIFKNRMNIRMQKFIYPFRLFFFSCNNYCNIQYHLFIVFLQCLLHVNDATINIW